MERSAKDVRGRFTKGQPINPAALRHARAAAGLTQAQLAAHCGLTKQAVSQFEQAKARPRRGTVQALAENLHVPVDAILARPRDSRELIMRELEERRRWPELERLATAVLAGTNVTQHTQAVARFYLGHAVLDKDPEAAVTTLRLARQELARLREPWLAAEARDWEGVALYQLQDPAALDVALDALARYRQLADRETTVEARMLEHVGHCRLQRQEIAEARRAYHAAIDAAGGLLNLARLAAIHHGLASACLRMGEIHRALDYFARAVNVSRIDHDARNTVSPALARLENDYGEALLLAGRLEGAEEMIAAALDHFDAAGVRAAKSHALLSMGDLRRQQGRLDEALRWTDEAIALADQLGEVVSLAIGYQQLGELLVLHGDHDRFEAAFARALELLDGAALPDRRAEALDRYHRIRQVQAPPLTGA